MKKILSVALAIFFTFSMFCGVFAYNENMSEFTSDMQKGGFLPDKQMLFKTDKGEDNTKGMLRGLAKSQTIYEFLETNLRNDVAEIKNIYPTYTVDINTFHTILRTVLFNNYDIFVYDNIIDEQGYFRGTVRAGTNYVSSFCPEYFVPEEGIDAAISMIDEEINAYVDVATNIPDDDVIGKMLVIHDLFCKNNVYATEEYEEEQLYLKEVEQGITDHQGEIHNETRLAYWVFKYNRAVCQGNSIALKAIYDELNRRLKENPEDEDIIKTSFCFSNKLGHIWNVVKVGGKWYHIDETWDDPNDPYKDGTVGTAAMRAYFLKTDAEMEEDHIKDGVHDWSYCTDETVTCDDTKYSSGYIFNKNFYGLISYSDGGYNLDIDGVEQTFRSESIIATAILSTESFDYEHEGEMKKAVLLYADEAVTAKQIFALYDENGRLQDNGCSFDKDIGLSRGITPVIYSPCRVFLWSPTNDEPMCRAIDIN